jgi:hypothetical protein
MVRELTVYMWNSKWCMGVVGATPVPGGGGGRVGGRHKVCIRERQHKQHIAAMRPLCSGDVDGIRQVQRVHRKCDRTAHGSENGHTGYVCKPVATHTCLPAWGACRFVADGVVPAAHFCSTISSRSSSSSPRNSDNYKAVTRASNGSSSSNGSNGGSAQTDSAPLTAAGDAVGGVCARVPEGTRERFVFFRGVQWSAPDINNSQLSQALMNLWPTRFPSNGSGGGSSSSTGAQPGAAGSSPLVAHAGVAGIAQVREEPQE